MWSEIVQQVSFSDVWLILVLDGVVKMTILLLAGWGVAFWMKRHSASARHIVWGLTLVATLLVPVGMWLLPGWGIERAISSTKSTNPLPPDMQFSDISTRRDVLNSKRLELSNRTSHLDVLGDEGTNRSFAGNVHPETSTENASPQTNGNKNRREKRTPVMEAGRIGHRPAVSESNSDLEVAKVSGSSLTDDSEETTGTASLWLIASVWGCGFVAVLLPFGVGLFRVTVLCRRADDVHERSWVKLLQELAYALGLRRSVRLM
ncbi:MAG: hypothetical protein KDA84_06795, partial [Planctomycetaceae bacterium]|nr:hypothetical protein [Planctomycetaceae bacterium]